MRRQIAGLPNDAALVEDSLEERRQRFVGILVLAAELAPNLDHVCRAVMVAKQLSRIR